MRIALLTYRGNPCSGGQGVYVRYLSRGLRKLGQEVTVVSGPPYPELDDSIPLVRLRSLDLYSNGAQPFRLSKIRDPNDFLEFLAVSAGFFPEPLTFGTRAYWYLRRRSTFDIVHDNQSLSFGLLALQQLGLPVIATVHHPIHIDRDLALAAARSCVEEAGIRRWYWFLWMQGLVARRLPMIITVSESSSRETQRAFGVPRQRVRTVYNGVDAEHFRVPAGSYRHPNRIIVVNSGDAPLKGLSQLFGAVERLACRRQVEVVVVGRPGNPKRTVEELRRRSLDGRVRFLGRLGTQELAREYAAASVAVVPSLYEGFGLPAAEAMACELPVVAYDVGALPEIIGPDGMAGRLVPKYDQEAMARAIAQLLDDPERRACMGAAGRERVLKHFTWDRAARETVALYEESLALRQEAGACSP